MKKSAAFFLLVIAAILLSQPVMAQEDTTNDADKRKQFLKEIRDYKHLYLTRELSLTKEQQKEFFPLYDQMEDEITALTDQTRDMEKKISDNIDEASDLELDKATEALFELKIKEGETEKEYAGKFKDVLSKKQLFLLKNAERNFSKELLQHQSRLRRKANK